MSNDSHGEARLLRVAGDPLAVRDVVESWHAKDGPPPVLPALGIELAAAAARPRPMPGESGLVRRRIAGSFRRRTSESARQEKDAAPAVERFVPSAADVRAAISAPAPGRAEIWGAAGLIVMAAGILAMSCWA